MMLIFTILLLVTVAVLALREVRSDGFGTRRAPRGPEEWTARHLPSHPYTA